MKITCITVGKIKEKFMTDAINEYAKRLSRYCKLEIVELADEKTPDNASAIEEENIKKRLIEVMPAYVAKAKAAGDKLQELMG